MNLLPFYLRPLHVLAPNLIALVTASSRNVWSSDKKPGRAYAVLRSLKVWNSNSSFHVGKTKLQQKTMGCLPQNKITDNHICNCKNNSLACTLAFPRLIHRSSYSSCRWPEKELSLLRKQRVLGYGVLVRNEIKKKKSGCLVERSRTDSWYIFYLPIPSLFLSFCWGNESDFPTTITLMSHSHSYSHTQAKHPLKKKKKNRYWESSYNTPSLKFRYLHLQHPFPFGSKRFNL